MITKIFKSLLPENITSDKFMSEVIEVFCDFIETNSKVSIDIGEVYNDKNILFKEEYIKIYLDDLYRTFKEAESSPALVNKIRSINDIYGYERISTSFISNISSIITNEHLITSKSFKQNKGTNVSIEYIYNLVQSLDIQDDRSDIVITEGEPFQMNIEGSIYKEMYESIVRPLSHPLGWTYIYTQVVKAALSDEFNLVHEYTNSIVEVRCLSGMVERYNKIIKKITEEYTNGRETTIIEFTDNSHLEQLTNPTEVQYYENGVLVKAYPRENHCSIFLSYDEHLVNMTTVDEVSFRESKTIDEDFYNQEGTPEIIGNKLYIGSFVIGQSSRIIQEEFDTLLTFGISAADITYEVFIYENSYYIGTFTIGEVSDSRIGGSYEVVNSITTEIYDMRNVQEEFEISTITI